ncbi:hypothetical protein N783_07360 [Pontibacillus marinus BH030004 = DSM 16465]|uniref:Uncharacterized protein n=1 Tax=Pontibacillus marinus BH030004 = DSM 16465 TaxID=1385511 RepID=A0A0A5HYN5_9BACI|nr:hypothetical protein N783_07360 [Pontibacillus marinus BH030004 = DSM 16465]
MIPLHKSDPGVVKAWRTDEGNGTPEYARIKWMLFYSINQGGTAGITLVPGQHDAQR